MNLGNNRIRLQFRDIAIGQNRKSSISFDIQSSHDYINK